MRRLGTLGLGVLLAGCATTARIHAPRMAESVAAVRAAEELGAAEVPAAAYALRMARDEIKAAERLLAEGDRKRAYYTLERAEADAELALALTREARAKDRAHALAQRLKAQQSTGEGRP